MSTSINRLNSGEFGSDDMKEPQGCRGRGAESVRRRENRKNDRLAKRRHWFVHRSKRESVSPYNSSSESMPYRRKQHSRSLRARDWSAHKQRQEYSLTESSDDVSWSNYSSNEEDNMPINASYRSQKQQRQQMTTPRYNNSVRDTILRLEGFAMFELNGQYRKCMMRKNHRPCYEAQTGFLLWYHTDSMSWVVTRNMFDYKYYVAYARDMSRSPLEISADWFLRRSLIDEKLEKQMGVHIKEEKSPCFEVGSVVSCKYRDGQWYNALIVGLNNDKTYRVQYLNDGLEVKCVSESNIKQEIFFSRGDRLQAQYGDIWYEVRIVDGSKARKEGTYEVEWLDSRENNLPRGVKASKLRCLRSSISSLNVDGMIAKIQSLSLAVDDDAVDIVTCKQGVDECQQIFKAMWEDSSRYENQLELKVEKCTHDAEDLAKRNTDNQRSIEIRGKKLKNINEKLKDWTDQMDKTESEIKVLQEKLKACKEKVEGMQEVKNREEKFLQDVNRIRCEVQEESVQVESEKNTLTRTLEDQQMRMSKIGKSLKEVNTKIDMQFKEWCKTWTSWTPDDLKRWIMTLGNGHFSSLRKQIESKVNELQLDGVRLSKVNDLVLKQFGLPDDDVRFLLEEINELTSGQAGGLSYSRNRKEKAAGKDPEESTMDSEGSDIESDDHLCVVCISAPKTHICVPCGHKCCCVNCIDRIGKECPICRTTVRMCIKIFD